MNFLQKPYDFTKYSAINFKMEDITDSFENGMFASMKRQTEEDYEDISASESPRKLVPQVPAGAISNKTPPNPSPREVDNNHRNLYDFSPTLTLTSDEDSTWQAPVSSFLYQKLYKKLNNSNLMNVEIVKIFIHICEKWINFTACPVHLLCGSFLSIHSYLWKMNDSHCMSIQCIYYAVWYLFCSPQKWS